MPATSAGMTLKERAQQGAVVTPRKNASNQPNALLAFATALPTAAEFPDQRGPDIRVGIGPRQRPTDIHVLRLGSVRPLSIRAEVFVPDFCRGWSRRAEREAGQYNRT
jgi:hypothetical protein